MSERCNTCAHWDAKGDPTDGDPTQRLCKNTGEGNDQMTVVYGEPYNEGTIATGPLFGCIHHQKKTP